MTSGARIFLACLMLGAALFCAYGFIATFEPPGWIAWRIAYATAGSLLLGGGAFVLSRRAAPAR